MHELHLMAQVVRAVDRILRDTEGAKPSVVRLKVSTQSHLFEHDEGTLQSAFAAAAQGTVAERAVLEILPVPVPAHCRLCSASCEMHALLQRCLNCGSVSLDVEQIPEVVIHEVVVEE